MLPASSLLDDDRIKLGDDVVANDRHVESTCDRIVRYPKSLQPGLQKFTKQAWRNCSAFESFLKAEAKKG